MATYTGVRAGSRVVVLVDGAPLCPRLDLHPLCPSGFDWGYPGSGPSQLALALLADHWPLDENRALSEYRRFMRQVIARISGDRWSLTGEDVDHLIGDMHAMTSVSLRRPPALVESIRVG